METMKYIKLFEKIDFDDWDYEEEDPDIDFRNIKIRNLYNHLGNLDECVKWLNENILDKHIRIIDRNDKVVICNQKCLRVDKGYQRNVESEQKVIIFLNLDVDGETEIYMSDKIVVLYDDDGHDNDNLFEELDFDENDWDWEEERDIYDLPDGKYFIKVPMGKDIFYYRKVFDKFRKDINGLNPFSNKNIKIKCKDFFFISIVSMNGKHSSYGWMPDENGYKYYIKLDYEYLGEIDDLI